MAHRAAVTQLASDTSAFPPVHPLAAAQWPLAEAGSSGRAVIVPDILPLAGAVAAPLWPDPVRTAVVLPLPAPTRQQPAGFLIIGTSPRQVLDAEYRNFLEPGGRTRCKGHRRRTRLRGRAPPCRGPGGARPRENRLLLECQPRVPDAAHADPRPLRELLAKPADALPPDARAMAEIAERNGSRLLRLVNSLLDFSRIEAGRAQACYEPTDLAKLTAELAASFQSACDSAGLALEIECPPLPEPIYVDRDMWEKIVLNLVSNAFKFTFEGHLAVRLSTVPAGVELRVADSGVGIPASELPAAVRTLPPRRGSAQPFARGQRHRPRADPGTDLACMAAGSRSRVGKARVRSSSSPSPSAPRICQPIKSANRDPWPPRQRAARPSSRRRAAGCRAPPGRRRLRPRAEVRRPGHASWSRTTMPTCATTWSAF
ncbi:sensor histidine kinase [Dankookia sp. P2]|uniref:sensor histidine kinase n=1 Tax=Dankookia sp. P2 TaxID=3423955 RepID=UPI003D66AFAC